MAEVNFGESNAAQQSTTAACLFDHLMIELNRAKDEHLRLAEGYRVAEYKVMGEAMRIALTIEADDDLKARFRKEMGARDVVYAALIFVCAAETEPARKMASKRARALRYLVEGLNVSLDKISEAVAEHGGIEKLARLAAQAQPRKKGRAPAGGAEDIDEWPKAIEAGKESEERPGDANTEIVDLDTPIQFGLPAALRAKLDQFSGTKITMTGYVWKTAGTVTAFAVEKIVRLKVAHALAAVESEADWGD
ncbi:hypothetical protein [Bradyrhizobium sp. McL0616]|uniref:hypothetical protein n=1 Tax=Bradyrhizobium sp. McL0616 TaxID=3415674 RepID=UPI003CFA26FF